jgi:hypothetical protein
MIDCHDPATLGLVRIGVPKEKRSVAFFAANQLTIRSRTRRRTRAKYSAIISM